MWLFLLELGQSRTSSFLVSQDDQFDEFDCSAAPDQRELGLGTSHSEYEADCSPLCFPQLLRSSDSSGAGLAECLGLPREQPLVSYAM